MTTYTFNPQLVADPVTFQRASNASVTVYDSGDTANATPLVLTDMNGLPLANPITSTSDGFLAGFKCPSTQVKLVGGGLTVIANSYQALLDQATAAQAAATSSAVAASAAAQDAIAAQQYVSGQLLAVDGGNASSVYTSTFNIDGGTANG